MDGRDSNGRFKKGEYRGGPGRPKKERELEYYRILELSVSSDDWAVICVKAVEQAKRGDAVARKFLADYLIGPPVEKKEITGADGGKLLIEYVNDWRQAE